jgi:hypothetical protein
MFLSRCFFAAHVRHMYRADPRNLSGCESNSAENIATILPFARSYDLCRMSRPAHALEICLGDRNFDNPRAQNGFWSESFL